MPGRPEGHARPRWKTADWGYVRFTRAVAARRRATGPRPSPPGRAVIAELWPREADVFVYFNNDAFGCAVCGMRSSWPGSTAPAGAA